MEDEIKELKMEEREKKVAELKAVKDRQDAMSDLSRGVCQILPCSEMNFSQSWVDTVCSLLYSLHHV